MSMYAFVGGSQAAEECDGSVEAHQLVIELREEQHRLRDARCSHGPGICGVKLAHETEDRGADVGRGGHERRAEHGAHRQAPVAERAAADVG